MRKLFYNSTRNLRSLWWIIIFLLLLAAFLIPAIVIAQKNASEVSIPVQALLIILVSLICQLGRKKSIIELTGRLNVTWLRHFFIGLITGGALMLFPALLLTATGMVYWQVSSVSFASVLSACILFSGVAIAEEFMFRGFLFQRLIESLGQWPAQLIMGGMFLLTHLDNPGMTGFLKILASLNIFIASLMFGIAFIKTKSLALPLGLHLMANFMQGTILGFGVSGEKEESIFRATNNHCPTWLTGGEFGLEASIFGLLTVSVFTVILYRWKKPV